MTLEIYQKFNMIIYIKKFKNNGHQTKLNLMIWNMINYFNKLILVELNTLIGLVYYMLGDLERYLMVYMLNQLENKE